MKVIAFAVGIAAVVLLILGYLQKTREKIIWFNVLSRALFILQYALLTAFEGAVLEVAGIIVAYVAQRKSLPLIKKHEKLFYLASCGLVIGMGLIPYQNVVSLLPIVGVLIHTSAFWLNEEKWIRRVSLLGSPFWFAYNVITGAYCACVGDILSVTSIVTAMMRYDFGKKSINGERTNHG